MKNTVTIELTDDAIDGIVCSTMRTIIKGTMATDPEDIILAYAAGEILKYYSMPTEFSAIDTLIKEAVSI